VDALILHAPILAVTVPLFAAFVTPLLGMASPRARNVFVIAALVLLEFVVIVLARDVYASGIRIYTLGAATATQTIPETYMVPVRLILEVDGLGVLMALLSSTVALAGAIYSIASIRPETGQDRFYTLLLLLTVGMMGIQLTGDLFNMFVFLEILSISGAALAAFRTRYVDAVEGGFKYLIVSSVSALLLLMAIGLFYGQYNALNMAMIAARMQFSVLDQVALVLIIAALAMKCGAVPMHFWTPDAYSMAPSSITALLVVASQASLYGLFRTVFTLYNVTLNAATVGWLLIILGVLSMVVGVTMAIPQKNVKRLMAYHAVSQTGYMLLGVGVGLAVLGNQSLLDAFGYMAMEGGIFHIINHAMYKGLLFLTAGAIFLRLGTYNLNRMGGLGHSMKWTMLFFVIGALAIAGIPPFNGFASKLMIYESVFVFNPLLAVIAMVVSILTLASFVKVFHSIFMGPALPEYAEVKEAPMPMLAGMGILAVVVILFGLFPGIVVESLIAPAAHALVDQGAYIGAVLGGA